MLMREPVPKVYHTTMCRHLIWIKLRYPWSSAASSAAPSFAKRSTRRSECYVDIATVACLCGNMRNRRAVGGEIGDAVLIAVAGVAGHGQ
jgi:hypothetical protein